MRLRPRSPFVPKVPSIRLSFRIHGFGTPRSRPCPVHGFGRGGSGGGRFLVTDEISRVHVNLCDRDPSWFTSGSVPGSKGLEGTVYEFERQREMQVERDGIGA